MLIFSDYRGIIHCSDWKLLFCDQERVITGRKINSKTCVRTPKRKKQHIASTGKKTPLILALQEG